MKKRIFALFLALLFVVSSFDALPVLASEVTDLVGGSAAEDVSSDGVADDVIVDDAITEGETVPEDGTVPEVDTDGYTSAEDFEFTVSENEECTITSYIGDSRVTALFIPPEIDGVPVTAIGDGAFSNLARLMRVELPDTLVSIGDKAFMGCEQLSTLLVPANVASVGEQVFYGCYRLSIYTYFECEARYELEQAGYSVILIETEHEHEYEWSETSDPTCSKAGYEIYRCSICPYHYYVSVPETEHVFEERMVEAICDRGAYTETYCINCQKSSRTYTSEPLGHTYGDWQAYIQPNCDLWGMDARTCTVCGYTGPLKVYSDSFPSCSKESYTNNMNVVYDTYTYPGAYRIAIYFSQTSELSIETDRLNVYEGSEVSKNALVTYMGGNFCGHCVHVSGDSFTMELITGERGADKGFEIDYIEVYHEDFIKEVDALGHDYTETHVEAACSIAEHTIFSCQRCGYETVEYSGEPLGHTYGDWATFWENPCTEYGYEARVCTVCKEAGPFTVKKEFPSDYMGSGNPSELPSEKIYDTVYCQGADKIYIDFKYYSSLASGCLYVYEGEYEEGKEPIYTFCSSIYDVEIGSDSFTLRWEPDADADYIYCDFAIDSVTVYDYDFVKELVPTGHVAGEYQQIVETSCTEDGMYGRVCTVCGNLATEIYRSDSLPACTGGDYVSNMDVLFEPFTYEGAQRLVLHFNDETNLENNYDKLYVYSGTEATGEALVSVLTGSFKTVTVDGDSFTLRMTSDGGVERYGFEIDFIEVYRAGDVQVEKAFGHSFGEFETVVESTCTSEGLRVKTCDRCGLTGSYTDSSDDLPSCTGDEYTDYMNDFIGTYTYEGAEKLIINFSENSFLEEYSDFLEINMGDCINEASWVSTQTGSFESVEIEGDTFTLYMRTNHEIQTYGFEVESVEVFYEGAYEIIPTTDHHYEVKEIISEASCSSHGLTNLYCTECGLVGIRTEKPDGLPSVAAGNVESAHVDYEVLHYPNAEKIVLNFAEGSALPLNQAYFHIYNSKYCDEENYLIGMTGEFPDSYIVMGDTVAFHTYIGLDVLETGFAVESVTVYTKDGYILTDALDHSFGEWTVVSEADCVSSGLSYGVCDQCGSVGYQTVSEELLPSFTGDSYEHGVEKIIYTQDVVNSDKTVIRFAEGSCLEENFDFVQIFTKDESGNLSLYRELTGNFYSEVIELETGEFSIGVKTDYSVAWDGFVVESIETYVNGGYVETDPWGHTPETLLGKYEVTCTENGYTEYICGVCGQEYQTDIIEAPGHSFDEWIVLSEATCSENGYSYATCSVCGLSGRVTETEGLPSCIGEEYVNNMYVESELFTAEGSAAIVITFSQESCLEANDYIEIIVENEDGLVCYGTFSGSFGGSTLTISEYDNFFVRMYTNSEGTDYGYEIEKVDVYYADGMVVENAYGHTIGETISVVEPTCTHEGYSIGNCLNCDQEIKFDYVSRYGHDYGGYSEIKAATCTQDGIFAATCARCQERGYRLFEDDTLPSRTGDEYKSETEFISEVYTVGGYDRFIITFGEGSRLGTNDVLEIRRTDEYGNVLHVESLYGNLSGRTVTVYGENFSYVLYTTEDTDGYGFEIQSIEAFCESGYYYETAYGHTPDGDGTVIEPTCSSEGYTSYTCVSCGEEFTDNYVPALDHIFGEMTETSISDCESYGYTYAVCTVCGHGGYEKDTSDSLPSCTGDAYVNYMDISFDEYYVPGATEYRITFSENSDLENSWDYVYVYGVNEDGSEYEATRLTGDIGGAFVAFSASSFYIRVTTDSSNLNYGFEIESVESFISGAYIESEPVGHDIYESERVDATCHLWGYVVYSCTRCDYTERVDIEPIEHDYQIVSVDADCVREGYTDYTCIFCGDSNRTDYVPAYGHSFGEYTEEYYVGCESEVYSYGYCENCGIAGYTVDESDSLPSCTGENYENNMEMSFEPYSVHGASYYRITFGENTCIEDNDMLYVTEYDANGNVSSEWGFNGRYTYDYTYDVYCDSFSLKLVTDDTYLGSDPIGFEVVKVETFVSGGYEQADSSGHDIIQTVIKEATCVSGGIIEETCSRCDYSITYETPAADHSYEETEYVAPTCVQEGYRTLACTVCGTETTETIAITGHSRGEIVAVVEPTCTEQGYTEYACSVCGGAIFGDYVEPVGHSIGDEATVVEPTCIEQGYTEYVCIVCGEAVRSDYVEPVGHSFGEMETVVAPTCTEGGYDASVCTVCGAVAYNDDRSDSLPSCIGSDYISNMNTDFDVYNYGGAESYKIYFSDSSNLEHGYDYVEVYGIDSDGSYVLVRSLTGSFGGTVVEIPYGSFFLRMTTDGSVTWDGFEVVRVESFCEIGSYEFLEALGHELELVSSTESTCTQQGVSVYECIRCDYSEEVYLDVLDHSWETETFAPTCTTDGYTRYICTVCGYETNGDYVEATGHSYGDMTEEVAATCTDGGYSYAICEICSCAAFSRDTSDSLPSCTGSDYVNSMNYTFDTYTVEGADYLEITFSSMSELESGWDRLYIYAVDEAHGETFVVSLTGNFSGTKVKVEASSFYMVMITDSSATRNGFEIEKIEAFGEGGFAATEDALGHELEETLRTEPTCQASGSVEYGCIRCDYTETEILEALDHSFTSVAVAPTCTEKGYTLYTCTLCGYNYAVDYVDATGHTDVLVESVAPTCTESGYELYECETCGNQYRMGIDPTGHVMGEWIVDKEPLLLEEGLQHRCCTACDFVEEQTIDKIVPDLSDGEYGLANFTVVNAITLDPISGAQLFISTAEDGETTLTTDGSGKVSAYLPVGAVTVSAYAEGCIIRNLKFDIVAGEKDYPNIGLSDISLYDVEITSTVMTQEEIIAAGIDTSDPANQHVVKYEMEIQFEPEIDWESIAFYFNGNGKFIPLPSPEPSEPEEASPVLHYHVINGDGSHKYCRVVEAEMGETVTLSYTPSRYDLFYRFNGWYADAELTQKITSKEITEQVNYVYGEWIYTGPEREVEPTPPVNTGGGIVYPVSENFYLIVRGEVQWQKEMFDVEMLIINNSQTDTMEDITATLELPDGLSLAAMTGAEQTPSQYVGVIGAGESRSVHWYVRGDKAGSYALKARLQGVMMPFNEVIDQVFVSEHDLQVWAGNALHLNFEFPDAAYYAEDYPIKITLTNVSDISLYNVSHAVQLTQGMEIFYSDGTSTTKISASAWESVGVSELKPGESIIIETTTNIFFESEIMERELERYINLVDGAEILYKGAKIVGTVIDILTFSVDCVETCETAMDVVLSAFDDFDEKLEWFGFLFGLVTDFNDAIKRYSDAAMDSSTQLIATEVITELEAIGEDPWGWYNSHSIDDIIELASKIETINKQIKTSAVSAKFDVFDSIRTAISAIPIKFAFSSITMNQESETTTIPYSYTVYDAGPQYFGVSNVSKYLEALTIAVAGTLYEDIVPWYARLIPGIDDPLGMEEAVDYIKATEKEIAKVKAKDATGKVTFTAWVETAPAAYNARTVVTANASEDFILSCDNESAVIDENGVLTFTGDGTIMVEPQNLNGGVLYIEDSEGNLYTYVIGVVEQHECVAGEKEVILAPTATTDGFAVKRCETCLEILDIIPMTSAECDHSFTEWVTVNEATCSSVGLITRECELCGMVDQSFTDMLAHTEGQWTQTKAPTCTETGEETTACTVCERALTREVAMIPHTEGEWRVAVEPTAFSTGVNQLHCAVCDAVMTTADIPMTNETFGLELDNESRIVTGFSFYITPAMLIEHYENMGMSITVTTEDGKTPRYVGTGCIIVYEGVEFTVAVVGDITGDGLANAKDMLVLKRYIKEGVKLEGADFVCADIAADGRLNARDTLVLKRIIMSN